LTEEEDELFKKKYSNIQKGEIEAEEEEEREDESLNNSSNVTKKEQTSKMPESVSVQLLKDSMITCK